MKNAVVETYKLSQTFNAPLDFVFEWCTDFREDDNKIIGSKTKRSFLEKGKKRMVWAVNYKKDGKEIEGIRAVWLHAPGAWHLETCGDGNEIGDYKLTSKGKNKTRLDMVFHVSYNSKGEVESKEEWEKDGINHWAIYADHLEKDYARSK